MKIIIINGSPRKNGDTARILHTIEQQLISNKNVSVEFVDISDLKMTPCSGCCSCYKTGHCYMNDDAEELSNRIVLADGLIIGSPTYVSNVPGQLKQFIDRGHFVIEQLLHGKYAISIAIGENYGSNNTSKILTKLLKYSGAKLSGKIIYNLPFSDNPNSNRKLEKQLRLLSNRIFNDIKTQKKYFVQSMLHKIIFSVGIKSFVKSKGQSYNGVVNRWENNHVVTGKI